MEETLNVHAKKRKVCVRSKAWWNQEISELRKSGGESDSRETTKPGGLQRCPANPKESHPKGQKDVLGELRPRGRQERAMKAVKYTAPKLEGKAQVLADEAGTKATSREERERMLIEAAFPRFPRCGTAGPTTGWRMRSPASQ